MNRIRWVAAVFGLFVWAVWQQWPEDRLRVIFCDVGQGDGALVILGSFQAVVDTGQSVAKISECLSDNIQFWDREIELVFVSHGDRDHMGALEKLGEEFYIGRIIDKPAKGDLIRYGSLSFEILKGAEIAGGVIAEDSDTGNDSSIVMLLTFGEFEALFTGDIDIPSELALMGMGVLRKIDVLKVPHHGSKYSSGSDFLEILKPSLAVISVGGKNSYGHPHGDTLLRIDAVGAKILRTDLLGSIEIKTDGKEIKVFSDKR